MLGLSPLRLVIVAVIGLILLGPSKLPEFARQAGALWHSLRTLQEKVETELHEAVPDLPRSADLVRFARSPVTLLNQLADRASAGQASTEGAGAESAGEGADEEVVEGEGYELPDEDPAPPPVKDPDRPPLAWGDPALN